jgi:hypothetical protein
VILIICNPQDHGAQKLQRLLAAEGAAAACIAIDEIVYARRIVHRIGRERERSEIGLARGGSILPEALSGVINRIETLPTRHLERVAAADRGYAMQEQSAFLLAWLDSLPCRVINEARANALGGLWLHPFAMRHLAAVAGLPTRPLRWSSDEDLPAPPPGPVVAAVVFDGKVFGPILPAATQAAIRRLSQLAGMALMQIEFDASPEGLAFRSAHGLVDPQVGGRPLARALAGSFKQLEDAA